MTPPSASANPWPGGDPVYLDASQVAAFAGDTVTLTVSSLAIEGATGLLLEFATIDFGDGSFGTGHSSCTAALSVGHTYRTTGDVDPTVTVVTPCGTTAADLSSASTTIHLFPSAPAVSASWPVCSTFQLRLAGPWTGAATGNVATLITIRNTGARGCTLEGYPGLVLIAADGSLLPTHVTPASTGAFMFPAVVPHRVGLPPGGLASFEIAYTDNPSGSEVNEPYDVACPSSRAVRVVLPETHQYGTATVPMGVCGGVVEVSPIVPGADGLRFS